MPPTVVLQFSFVDSICADYTGGCTLGTYYIYIGFSGSSVGFGVEALGFRVLEVSVVQHQMVYRDAFMLLGLTPNPGTPQLQILYLS